MTYDGNSLRVKKVSGSTTTVYIFSGSKVIAEYLNAGSSGTYSYDGNNLRVEKVSGSTTTVTIFSGGKDIAEYDNGASPSSPSREYIYSGSTLLAKFASGVSTYYQADLLSNRLVTDSSGNVVEQLGTYPFGESWYNSTNDKLLFTTYARDSESTNDYALARSYVNRLGRFSSLDPLSGDTSNPQSLNRFAYVLDDPINSVDPTGMLCVDGDGNGIFDDSGVEVYPLEDSCTAAGGTWIDPSTTTVVVNGDDDGSDGYGSGLPPGGCSFFYQDGDLQGTACGNLFTPVTGSNLTTDPARALATAINNTGVQSLANPCTVALFYGGSAFFGSAGAAAAGGETAATARAVYEASAPYWPFAFNYAYRQSLMGFPILRTMSNVYGQARDALQGGCQALQQ